MSLKNKYSNSDCGCGRKTPNHKNFGLSGCCNSTVQTAPSPCCESHDTKIVAGMCLNSNCTITATVGRFSLGFSNLETVLSPLNANEQFFYHAGAGFMRILGFDGEYYSVSLLDESRAGAVIEPSHCIQLQAIAIMSGGSSGFTRCLTGLFSPPANGQTSTIFIKNGAAIPIGATISFTSKGEVGSYTVASIVSSEGEIYAYSVRNDSSGHTAGVTIDGGDECDIPIDVTQEIDLCDLTNSAVADQLTGCAGGAPVGIRSSFENSVLAGDKDGGWVQRRLPEGACCVLSQNTIKFVGQACPTGFDTVTLQPTNIECFTSAFNFSQSRKQPLVAWINDLQIVFTSFDPGTRVATIEPALPGNYNREFGIGTQICLAECCKQCTTGPEIPDFRNPGTSPQGTQNAFFEYNTTAAGAGLVCPTGVSYWLVGAAHGAGAVVSQRLQSPYFANPSALGPRLPRITDALLLRQKFCNPDVNGCNKFVEFKYNYDLVFNPIVADVTIDWEIGSYIDRSKTLADGVTPNPFTNMSSIAKATGRMVGPSVLDTQITNSGFGHGQYSSAKVFPVFAGAFSDYMNLSKCSCGLAVLWFFARVDNGSVSSQTIHIGLGLRRVQIAHNVNVVPYANNETNSEGW